MSDGQGDRHPRIAVINDDSEFLSLMEQVLTDEGYDVDLMRTFSLAHEKVRDSHPDVVILDVVGGQEERGWTLLELLRLDPRTTEIPVIVCSAAVRALEERRHLLESQGIIAVAKPFGLEQLRGVIGEALTRSEGVPHM